MQSKCQQLVGLNGYHLTGMGEVTDAEIMQIFKEELSSVDAVTLSKVILSGDYTPIKDKLKNATARVCKLGAIDETKNFVKEYWIYMVAGIVILYLLFS